MEKSSSIVCKFCDTKIDDRYVTLRTVSKNTSESKEFCFCTVLCVMADYVSFLVRSQLLSTSWWPVTSGLLNEMSMSLEKNTRSVISGNDGGKYKGTIQ